MQYVVYERSYRGLPVQGGDAVVVTDTAGMVLSNYVAQDQALSVGTTPAISAAAAARTARKQLAEVTSASKPALKVVAEASAPPRFLPAPNHDPEESLMRKVVLAAVLTAGLAGCAGADQSGPSASGATPAPTASAAVAAFPLTVTRTGGFAGVDDRAEIAADGTVVVTRGGQAPVRTSLPFVTVAELRQLLARPDFPRGVAPSAGGAVCNDGFEYEFVSPASTGKLLDCGVPEQGTPGRVLAIARELFQG